MYQMIHLLQQVTLAMCFLEKTIWQMIDVICPFRKKSELFEMCEVGQQLITQKYRTEHKNYGPCLFPFQLGFFY